MNVLIVDDERIAREGVRMRLEKSSYVDSISECSNGIEAISFIQKQKPDLVFLDVQMPGLDGFGVIEKVGTELMPIVIFVTAYDKYALKAFEFHAFDYLLKPFDDERFHRVFERAKRQFKTLNIEIVHHRLTSLLEDLRPPKPFLERIVVKTAGRIFFVNTEEIDWLEAADNYVKIYVGREKHLIREKISHLENQLKPNHFLRIHRSIIINTNRIKELQPLSNQVFSVILKDGTSLTSGRHFRENFRRLLGE